jgi:small nuclear ribonucleoprotein (snRNP)-like protein
MGPRRRDSAAGSLVAVVQALEGHKVVVELRNDVVLRGMLDSVDQYLK